MAPPVYSLRIFASAGLVPATGTVGPVVPAGLIYVVRDIDVFSHTLAVNDNLFLFNQVLGVLQEWQVHSVSDNPHQQWTGRQVYREGEQVGFRTFQGNWSIACSGYQLTTP